MAAAEFVEVLVGMKPDCTAQFVLDLTRSCLLQLLEGHGTKMC